MKLRFSRRRFVVGTIAIAGAGFIGSIGNVLLDLFSGFKKPPVAQARYTSGGEATRSISLEQTGIDPKDFPGLFQELQGNILRSHDRTYSVHMFLKFKGPAASVKQWIRGYAETYVTSAAKEEEEQDGRFGSLFLSANAYWFLGLPMGPQMPADSSFRSSMKVRYGAKDIESWQQGFQEKEIHALVLLADNDEAKLGEAVAKVTDDVNSVADILTTEKGIKKVDPEGGYTVEPFGYRDGISQPLFLKSQLDQISETDQWDPSANLDLVLVRDPNGKSDDSYGSYLAYQKLEQDVAGWNAAVVELAGKLDVDPNLAGALTVGRFKDGTPVALSNRPQNNPTNNFNYKEDPDGAKSPFQSHARKTNPRGDTPTSLEVERDHRIVRRPMTFETGTETGRLFLVYQSDIIRQFEFMQGSWANQNQFVKQGVGQDAVAGLGDQEFLGGQSWQTRWGDPNSERVRFDFSHFVKLRGGEYFFTPSISFLKSV